MRLLTRPDLDGLACGALLKSLGLIESWSFAHPKDMQDGLVEVGNNDIICNLPYAEGCKMWFDHHSSEVERIGSVKPEGLYRQAPSAARLVYEYFGGEDKLGKYAEMLKYVDKVDSADLTREEIENPQGWVLLGFITDPRTGMGRFRDFRIGNFDFMGMLMQSLTEHSLEEILKLPDVVERIEMYDKQNELFRSMITQHTKQKANVIVTDLRGVKTIHTGNRFLVYGLFPEASVSLWVVDGHMGQVSIAVGHSILNRTSSVDIGSLMLKYGGGGHKQVGTCQVPSSEADDIISQIVTHLVSSPENSIPEK